MINRLRTIVILFAMFVLASVGTGATTVAQDATPQASPALTPSEGYPVAVHQGSCDSPGPEAAWQLDNAIAVGAGDNENEPTIVGPEITTTVSQTMGPIDSALDDLANDEHVVAVHASDEEFGTIVACGQIAGVKEQGKLVIALAPVGENTVVGIAIFEEDGNDQTQLTVYVLDQAMEDASAGM